MYFFQNNSINFFIIMQLIQIAVKENIHFKNVIHLPFISKQQYNC